MKKTIQNWTGSNGIIILKYENNFNQWSDYEEIRLSSASKGSYGAKAISLFTKKCHFKDSIIKFQCLHKAFIILYKIHFNQKVNYISMINMYYVGLLEDLGYGCKKELWESSTKNNYFQILFLGLKYLLTQTLMLLMLLKTREMKLLV